MRSTHATRRHALVLGAALSGTACWSLTTERDGVFGPTPADAAARPEAGVPGNEGGSSGDSGGGRFCSGLAASATRQLCFDFDVDEELSLGIGGGARTSFRAAGAGRELVLEGPAGTDAPRALMSRETPGLPGEARVGIDLAVDSIAGRGSAISVIAFVFRRNDDYHKVEVWIGDGPDIAIAQGGSFGPGSFLWANTSLTLGRRYRIEFDAVFTGAAAAAVARVDGVETVRLPLGPLPVVDEEVSLEVGMSVGPPRPTQNATIFRLDNVVYDLLPR
jgi:hypothetical protein